MEGIIVSYRGSRRTQKANHIVVRVSGVTKRADAAKLLDKKVTWTNPIGKESKKISGIIKSAHGNSGCVRVIFEKGLPGQSLGTKVSVEA